jgi:tetratricopeptide (TPR) repeat protein
VNDRFFDFPAKGQSLVQSGLRHKRDNRLLLALADFDHALSAAPRHAALLCEIAECLNGLGRHRRALLASGEAIAIDGGLAMAWFHRAFAHQMLSQPDLAAAAYLEVIRRDPGVTAAHARLANLHALQGRYQDARGFAEHALAQDPANATALLALVRADMAQDRLDQAEARLFTLLSTDDPDLKAMALSFLGDLRDAQDRAPEAFQAYRDAGLLLAQTQRARMQAQESGSAQLRRVIAAFHAPAGQTGTWQ